MIVRPAKQKPRVYNLSWYTLPPASASNPAVVARHNTSTISDQKSLGVVILYPALATPEILVGDTDKLEILLLTQKAYDIDKLRMHIRYQLKISAGLDPAKAGADRSLFVDGSGTEVGSVDDRTIDIEEIPFGTSELLTTLSSRFSGYVDKRAHKIYSDAGYKTLYRVQMSSKALEAAMGSSALSSVGEPQDLIIDKMLDNRSSWAKQEKDGKYYCFASGGGDIDHTKFDTANPIQSYHPVFHYGEGDLAYANLGHLSDVHLAARQQVLGKSKARVIDYWDMGSDVDLPNSPFIGDLVNICSKDMIQIMGKLSTGTDILLIGGDLVDFLRSCYLSPDVSKDVATGIPSHVWKAVGLGSDYTKTYKDGVDMIGFFSILLNYCRTNQMPAYAISGNHDCYHLPYGLSPRIDVKVAERRANEGIPSDHNLTFYEAILAFGETYRELKSGLSSPFQPDLFDWFYMVFTPFTDYSVELPKQYLVAFGWGDREDLLDTPGTGHGFGHLPRSKDTVSDEQLGILTTAIQKKKNVLLMTHFTFASYDYSIPVNQGDTELGDVYISFIKNYNRHNFGTFEQNRQKMFATHCVTNRDIQIILTGHSHRRALYLADRLSSGVAKRTSVKTRHFDFDDFSYAKAKYKERIQPAIIVSDSGGTIPRYNLAGEFNGRGSDQPSGTSIRFDPGSGDLSGVAAERADACVPRFVVGLDYLDIQEKNDVIASFKSDPFSIEDEKTGKLTVITFKIALNPFEISPKDAPKTAYWITSLAFFLKLSLSDPWRKIALTGAGTQFSINGATDVQLFSNSFATNRSRGNFLAMKFGLPPGSQLTRYNFDSPWCWEFQVDSDTSGGGAFGAATDKVYIIKRNKKRAEIPDFDWRRTNMPGKYK